MQLKKSEKEYQSLLPLLYLYKTQVAELELEISDLKAALKAKDYEISSFKQKHHSRSFSQNLDPSNISMISTLKSERNELEEIENIDINSLKIRLNKEREKGLKLEEENSRLSSILKSTPLKNELLTKESEIKSLVSMIHKLREENEDLKIKNIEEHSTAVKSYNTSEVKSFEIPIDSDNGSAAESTPRFESALQGIKDVSFKTKFPKDALMSNPEPPRTRIESSPVTKIITNRKIKHVSCDLSDISQPSVKYRNVAEFCPTYMRRFK